MAHYNYAIKEKKKNLPLDKSMHASLLLLLLGASGPEVLSPCLCCELSTQCQVLSHTSGCKVLTCSNTKYCNTVHYRTLQSYFIFKNSNKLYNSIMNSKIKIHYIINYCNYCNHFHIVKYVCMYVVSTLVLHFSVGIFYQDIRASLKGSDRIHFNADLQSTFQMETILP